MTTQLDRIAELENQVEALTRRVARLDPQPTPAPPARERPSVSIIQRASPQPPPEILPTETQFVEFRNIVLEKFPSLALNGERGVTPGLYHQHFKAAPRPRRYRRLVDHLD